MKKVFSLATIPERVTNLEKVINSIIDQTDYGFVILNGFDNIPLFFKNYPINKITILRSQDIGDKGASNKFYPLVGIQEDIYYFSCDDDIIYPKNYCSYMMKKAKELNAIVVQHGRRPIISKMSDYLNHTTSEGTHFKERRLKDKRVAFGGTGVMCFSTELFNLDSMDYFPTPYPADFWIGLEAFKRGINIFCVSSDEKLEPIPYENTIFRKEKEDYIIKIVEERFKEFYIK